MVPPQKREGDPRGRDVPLSPLVVTLRSNVTNVTIEDCNVTSSACDGGKPEAASLFRAADGKCQWRNAWGGGLGEG